jgi:hypothetical protein
MQAASLGSQVSLFVPELLHRPRGPDRGRPHRPFGGCDGRIPPNPPKEAIDARRAANRAVNGGDDDHYHTVANPSKGERPGERGAGPPKPTGYRPGRKTQQRRQGKNNVANPQATSYDAAGL